MVRRARSSAPATPFRSPRISVMEAASLAMSVPVPMAMPTSACASAGASLMPSPTMATFLPAACNFRTSANLASGSTSASEVLPSLLSANMSIAGRIDGLRKTHRVTKGTPQPIHVPDGQVVRKGQGQPTRRRPLFGIEYTHGISRKLPSIVDAPSVVIRRFQNRDAGSLRAESGQWFFEADKKALSDGALKLLVQHLLSFIHE